MLDVAIIGGGLSGLSLALQLQQQARDLGVYEAAPRFGGRVLSLEPTGQSPTNFRYDLGPGWLWPHSQPLLAAFLDQYAIPVFAQWQTGKSLYHRDRHSRPETFVDPASYAGAYRVEGGIQTLVDTLLNEINPPVLNTGYRLARVIDHSDHVELGFDRDGSPQEVRARKVVMTLPPRLLVDTVSFTPQLDPQLRDSMRDTSTWMAGHAKAVIRYHSPFWREQGLSGNAFCTYQGAPLSEIFDASPSTSEYGVVSGFFGLPPALRQQYHEDLNALIVDQLVRLFGKPAVDAQEIVIKDWFTEPLTASAADEISPTAHPLYGHRWLQLDHWNDKLYFGGTETAAQFGGYLEGALVASQRVARQLFV